MKHYGERKIVFILVLVLVLSSTVVTPVKAENMTEKSYQEDEYCIDYKVKSQWEKSQSIGVTITNTGTEPIKDWVVKYDVGGVISELENAKIYEQSENTYFIKCVENNYEILPEEKKVFSYVLTGEDLVMPEQIKIVSKRVDKEEGYEIKFKISDWGTSFQAVVTISNTSERPIESWKLNFDGEFGMGNLWDGRKAQTNDTLYAVECCAWNSVIPVDGSCTFGFMGYKNSDEQVELKNITLSEMIMCDEPEYPQLSDDGIIDAADIEELIRLGLIETIRGEDGEYHMIDGTFTGQKVLSIGDAAKVLNSMSSLFGKDFHASEQEITVQHAEDVDGTHAENYYRYNPIINGVPVLGGQMVLVTDGKGCVTGLFSTYNNRLQKVNTIAMMTVQTAQKKAITHLLKEENIVAFIQQTADTYGYEVSFVKEQLENVLYAETELVIFDSADALAPVLAWKVQISSVVPEEKFTVELAEESAESVDQEPIQISISENEIIIETVSENEIPFSVSENDVISDIISENDSSESNASELPTLPLIRKTVFVKANGTDVGYVLDSFSDIYAATVSLDAIDLLNNNRTITVKKENEKYQLIDLKRNIETYKTAYKHSFIFTEPLLPGEIVELSNETSSPAAVSAHANLEEVYDFYKTILNRKSYNDDVTTKIIASVNFNDNGMLGGNTENAFWSPNDKQFLFGNKGNFEAALDVVGHEYTHAVIGSISGTEHNPILRFSRDSYALNEGYSDVMGSLIEGKNDINKWLFGEDTDNTFRNMENPKEYNQAMYYEGENWSKTTSKDYDAHFNSGVFTHAVYLMMTDSRTKTIPDQKWAKVLYRSLFRLTTRSEFDDVRGAILSTAKRYGFTVEQRQAIRDAFDAVGVTEPNSIRIVLRWGEQPGDLDMHLIGPSVKDDSQFHVSYLQKTYFTDGTYSSDFNLPIVDLDYDVKSSYGPEIITIHKLLRGEYYLYIHDYTNRYNSYSYSMAKSGAVVDVYIGDSATPIKTFMIGTKKEGTLWSVFKLTIPTQGEERIEEVNEYRYCSDPHLIGGTTM